MKKKFGVVMTTTDSLENARQIAKMLINNKAAACVQMLPIESFYTWEKQFTQSKEYLLLIKTKDKLYKKVEEIILENHDYDTPEIIQLPINKGLKKYFKWMDAVTGSD